MQTSLLRLLEQEAAVRPFDPERLTVLNYMFKIAFNFQVDLIRIGGRCKIASANDLNTADLNIYECTSVADRLAYQRVEAEEYCRSLF